jgi:hypothetical protein
VVVGATFTVTASYSIVDASQTTGLQQIITIPTNTPTGNGYKISIGSTSPTFNGGGGAGASSGFTVNALQTPSVSILPNPTELYAPALLLLLQQRLSMVERLQPINGY